MPKIDQFFKAMQLTEKVISREEEVKLGVELKKSLDEQEPSDVSYSYSDLMDHELIELIHEDQQIESHSQKSSLEERVSKLEIIVKSQADEIKVLQNVIKTKDRIIQNQTGVIEFLKDMIRAPSSTNKRSRVNTFGRKNARRNAPF
jgi:uncharacterized coiled-coil protein SlyX